MRLVVGLASRAVAANLKGSKEPDESKETTNVGIGHIIRRLLRFVGLLQSFVTSGRVAMADLSDSSCQPDYSVLPTA